MADSQRILVIDDSEDDRFLYRRALKGSDYEIVESDSGENGLDSIGEIKPACILLDYSLPGRNGIEVLKRIRSKFPFVAVIMLTGQGNENVAVTAIREGAQHYLAKSAITPAALQRSVHAAIEHCSLERDVFEQRQSLELFTRALAHDLKEPVRTIRSYIELVMRQALPPEKTRQYFDFIMQAAERMGALIDTVYLYMRLDHSARQAAQEACDMTQALTEAKENLAALIRERGARIEAEALPSVIASRMQLVQLLQNLVGNALRHCEETPVIRVSARLVGGMCECRVEDNGPGVPQEYRERIFEPFKRLVRHKEDGLGLGLAICRKIAESCGGRIWCEGREPHGAAFCFTLPAAAPAAAVLPAASPHTAPAATDQSLATVLIVEDNEADVELLRYTLVDEQKLRCRLAVSRNGREALERLQEARDGIDLVLLDINMPGMDGFELLAHMHDDGGLARVPVVMCTTSTYDRDIEQAKALGAAGYLVKPLDFVKLRAILGSLGGLALREEQDGRALMRAA